MMFDPPDYPYKELSETYDPDDLLFTNDPTESNETLSNVNKNPSDVTTILNTVESQISFHSNDSGRFFNIENSSFFQENSNREPNTELYIIQSDNIFNYEPTLLDENTVNQFLLPLQDSSGNTKVLFKPHAFVDDLKVARSPT